MSEQFTAGADSAATEEVKVPAEVSTDAVQDGDVDPQAKANDGEHEQAKRKGGFQRTIEKQKREIEFWRDQALKEPKTAASAKEEPKAEPKAKPEPKDFVIDGTDTYDVAKYAEAVADWKVETRLAEADKKREESAKVEKAKSEQQQTIEGWQKVQGKSAREAYADFDEAIGSAEVVASPLMHEAIMTSEVGGHLAYYFATHEDEALAISRMNGYQQSKAISKIEAQFAPQESAEEDEDKEPPVPPVKKAPAPPTPVSKPSAAHTKSVYDEDLPYKDFVKMREAQTKRK